MKKILSTLFIVCLAVAFMAVSVSASNPLAQGSGYDKIVLEDFDYADGNYVTLSGIDEMYFTDAANYQITNKMLSFSTDRGDITFNLPIGGTTRAGGDGDWSEAVYFGYYVNNTLGGSFHHIPMIVNADGQEVRLPGNSEYRRVEYATGFVSYATSRESDGMCSVPADFEGYVIFDSKDLGLIAETVASLRFYVYLGDALKNETVVLDDFFLLTGDGVSEQPQTQPDNGATDTSPETSDTSLWTMIIIMMSALGVISIMSINKKRRSVER